ncbi:DUF2244 domain-containing protein [Xinfangfangia sp. D13-10-4-6]|uniref:DUF2244 domain-containing protein n=1 Tax=Pseudogemmobacter hezensis TaxID=2737662 RepID=UPI0015558D99|nr:DUF2244 domain-containing protein [Pseudogemmobacter hezensis]NPD16243.1 DUF2244 domain-containing protein [Pseudogemmobacter hezensis]
MPYRWSDAPDGTKRLRLTPWSALSRSGFAWFIGVTAALIILPLLSVIATPVFWGLLPFVLLAMATVWIALKRSWSDHAITEDLVLTPDLITLTRHGPRKRVQSWQANPYWVSVHIRPQGGPVPDYLTLRGEGREVEIGPFLTPPERRALLPELQTALARTRQKA